MASPTDTTETKTIYEQIGGDNTVRRVVPIFYSKILQDKSINHFFHKIDMSKQIQKQHDFVTVALGGPNNYKGKDMREAHKNLNLVESDFDSVVGHLGATLTEIGCPENLIGQIAGALIGLKDEVLNKQPGDGEQE